VAIVRLAWARELGLPDPALSKPAGGLITRPSDEVIMFFRLWPRCCWARPRSSIT
jgi:hypothetical protein